MKKIAVLSLAILMALGALGIGYAAWTDSITVSGPIKTGVLDIVFLDYFLVNDPCGPPGSSPDWTADVGLKNYRRVPELKDVGCVQATWIDESTVDVTVNNAYPCYLATVSVHTVNQGTIPYKLRGVKLTYPDPFNPGSFVTVNLPDGVVVYIPGFDQYGGISNVYEVKWVNGTGAQIEPGEEHEDSFHLHVLQPAIPGTQYTFTITREVIQWNEYTGP